MYETPDGRRVSLIRAWNGRPIPRQALTVRLLRDWAEVGDLVSVEELGDGWIRASYRPSSDGFDLLEFLAPDYGFRAADHLASPSVHRLNHDFRSPGYLRLYHPEAASFRVRVYRRSDWLQGRQQPEDAVAETGLDAQGRWLEPVFVYAGAYVVAAFRPGEVFVLNPALEVGPQAGDPDYALSADESRAASLLLEDLAGTESD